MSLRNVGYQRFLSALCKISKFLCKVRIEKLGNADGTLEGTF
jgi:hypothetical protein